MKQRKSRHPTDVYVGSRLRMRRMMLSMSQEKLGEALGLTFQQVRKYEKGRTRVGASRLEHMPHLLQVPVLFFFDAAPSVTGNGSPQHPVPPDDITGFMATRGLEGR
jgi:transcriptional regulator with XRE-family HTH domain